jgi:hypothetical protein
MNAPPPRTTAITLLQLLEEKKIDISYSGEQSFSIRPVLFDWATGEYKPPSIQEMPTYNPENGAACSI